MKFSGKVGNGPVNKWLNFRGDPDHGSDAFPDPGKTCLGGGMHCPSASSFIECNKLSMMYDNDDAVQIGWQCARRRRQHPVHRGR